MAHTLVAMEDSSWLREAVISLVSLVLCICVHEFGHAFVADLLGDRLPREQGRVTLNPVSHIDPVGTLFMPLLAILVSLHSPAIGSRILGWGRPVQVSVSARGITRKVTLKTAHLLIAAAGPGTNIVFAMLLSLIYVVGARLFSTGMQPFTQWMFTSLIAGLIAMNFSLAFFNLIPCPPLDGGAILRGLLPRSQEWISDRLDQYGSMLLMALLLTGMLGYVMIPAQVLTNSWLQLLVKVAWS